MCFAHLALPVPTPVPAARAGVGARNIHLHDPRDMGRALSPALPLAVVVSFIVSSPCGAVPHRLPALSLALGFSSPRTLEQQEYPHPPVRWTSAGFLTAVTFRLGGAWIWRGRKGLWVGC